MPYSEHFTGHVTYDTIVLYFVEYSLITIWEKSIYTHFSLSLSVREGKPMFEAKESYFYVEIIYIDPPSSIFLQVAFFVGVY